MHHDSWVGSFPGLEHGRLRFIPRSGLGQGGLDTRLGYATELRVLVVSPSAVSPPFCSLSSAAVRSARKKIRALLRE